MLTKKVKQDIVAGLEGGLKNATSAVFVTFHGLVVADVNMLRRNLEKAGVNYKVARKTLLKRALAAQNYEGTLPELTGEIAVATSTDPLAAAREVYEFQKTHKDNVSIAGGMFEGKYMSQAEMLSIATIPSRDVLLAQFLNLINSPIQRFVVALGQIAEKKA